MAVSFCRSRLFADTPPPTASRGNPGRKNRTEPIAYGRHLYRERNVVERDFARIKQHRRVATRFDKKAANFLGFVWVVSIAIMLA
jgi:putative transposase